MAWCRQATSHYLTQCWPRSVSPCGIPRPLMSEVNYFSVLFKIILRVDFFHTSCEICIRWAILNHIEDKSTLVQVMAQCHRATSHFKEFWPRSVSQYDDSLHISSVRGLLQNSAITAGRLAQILYTLHQGTLPLETIFSLGIFTRDLQLLCELFGWLKYMTKCF